VNAALGDGTPVAFAGKTGLRCGDDEDKGSGKKQLKSNCENQLRIFMVVVMPCRMVQNEKSA
jgi:hypothetical protein